MTLFATLAMLAAVFFVAHVVLLFTSFPVTGFLKQRYFWSHATLWVFGIIVFLMATLFAGQGLSAVADVFDTPAKRLIILAIVAIVSLIAHTVVRLLVLPRFPGAK